MKTPDHNVQNQEFFNGIGWFLTFNFLYDRGYALNLLDAAENFLKAAEFMIQENAIGTAVDNLFSACELISKVHLRLHTILKPKSKVHGQIHSKINNWSKLGNVNQEFVKLFNKLTEWRARCRYEGHNPDPQFITDEEIKLINEELITLRNRCKRLKIEEESNPLTIQNE